MSCGSRSLTSCGSSAAMSGASSLISVVTPERACFMTGRMFFAKVFTVLTISLIRFFRSAFLSPIPAIRFAHAAFTEPREPETVVAASFEVVPVMSRSVCTLWIASIILSNDTLLTVFSSTFIESPSTPESLISLAISACVPP